MYETMTMVEKRLRKTYGNSLKIKEEEEGTWAFGLVTII